MNDYSVKPYTTLSSLIDLCRNLYESDGISKGKNEYYEYYSFLPSLAYQNRLAIKKLPQETKSAYEVLDNAISIVTDSRSPMYLSYCDDIIFPVADYLESKGMKEIFCQAGMAYIISNEIPELKQNVYEINPEQLNEWVNVSNEAFGINDEIRRYEHLLANDKCKLYACEAEGKIVSTGLSCLDNNNSNMGVHNIATLENARGYGYATAIVTKIIHEAQKMNIPLLTLQASPLGEPVYTSLGFKKITMLHSFAKI